MNTDNFHKNYTMQSVHKAIAVLRAFSKDEPRLSLTDLHKKTGIGMSSLQRFVSTLVFEGFLHKDEKTKQYQLGLSLLLLGNLVEQESSLLTVAKPILTKLNNDIGESISLNIMDGDERRCLINLESTHTLSTKAYVGDTSPLYAGASAKSLLAFLPAEELAQYLQRVTLKPITENTYTDQDVLLADLANIRQQGYAFSKGERVFGAVSVSAPILLSNGRPLASITIVIPEVRFPHYEQSDLIRDVIEAARQIERQLH